MKKLNSPKSRPFSVYPNNFQTVRVGNLRRVVFSNSSPRLPAQLQAALFEAVQLKKHGKRPHVLHEHNPIFKGLITCEACGKLVVWQLQKGRYYGICKRTAEGCKTNKMLREDHLEAMVMELLEKLVCPSPEVIEWGCKRAKRCY